MNCRSYLVQVEPVITVQVSFPWIRLPIIGGLFIELFSLDEVKKEHLVYRV